MPRRTPQTPRALDAGSYARPSVRSDRPADPPPLSAAAQRRRASRAARPQGTARSASARRAAAASPDGSPTAREPGEGQRGLRPGWRRHPPDCTSERAAAPPCVRGSAPCATRPAPLPRARPARPRWSPCGPGSSTLALIGSARARAREHPPSHAPVRSARLVGDLSGAREEGVAQEREGVDELVLRRTGPEPPRPLRPARPARDPAPAPVAPRAAPRTAAPARAPREPVRL